MDIRFVLNAETVGNSHWTNELGDHAELTATLSKWAERLQDSVEAQEEMIGNTISLAVDTVNDNYSEEIYIVADNHVIALYARSGQWRFGDRGTPKSEAFLAELLTFINSINV